MERTTIAGMQGLIQTQVLKWSMSVQQTFGYDCFKTVNYDIFDFFFSYIEQKTKKFGTV
jgi:hypothetical protein